VISRTGHRHGLGKVNHGFIMVIAATGDHQGQPESQNSGDQAGGSQDEAQDSHGVAQKNINGSGCFLNMHYPKLGDLMQPTSAGVDSNS
jgi:hypothetical protein